MTYKMLLVALENMEDEQLDMPIMACVDEEFYTCTTLNVQENNDQLQDGHPYLQVD